MIKGAILHGNNPLGPARRYFTVLSGSALSSGLFEYTVFEIYGQGEAAMNALGEINGRNVNDDIVSSIFSKFCVGK